MEEKIALFASAAVFVAFWLLFMFLHFSGSLISVAVASGVAGMKEMVKFGFIGTIAIIPAILTYVVVYMVVYFQEKESS